MTLAPARQLLLVVLRAPTPPKPLDAARSQQLMAAHMANINRLVKEETMLFAGPLVQTRQCPAGVTGW